MPPLEAHAPMAMHHFGSGIWSHTRLMTGAILSVGVPATIIKSDWRGLGRKTPAPNRSISKRDAPVAIISIAQQASPNVIGHSADLRAQLNTKSTVVVIIPLEDSIVSSLSFAIILLRPFQRAFAPGIVITDHRYPDEHEHLDQAEKRQLVIDHRPRKQEYRLDVEYQKQHRHDVEPN